MFRVKYKKEQILKGLRCFSIEIAILWTIILIDTLISTYYGKYSGIHLSQVVASIPKEYMNSEESEHYKTDNEFLIQSKENAYMIYGIELSNVDERGFKKVKVSKFIQSDIRGNPGWSRIPVGRCGYRKYKKIILYMLLFFFNRRRT